MRGLWPTVNPIEMTQPHLEPAHAGFRVPARPNYPKGQVVKAPFLPPGASAPSIDSRTRDLIDEINTLLKIEEVLTPIAFGALVTGIDRASANGFLDTATHMFAKLRERREFVRVGGRLDPLAQMMLVFQFGELWHLLDPLLEHIN